MDPFGLCPRTAARCRRERRARPAPATGRRAARLRPAAPVRRPEPAARVAPRRRLPAPRGRASSSRPAAAAPFHHTRRTGHRRRRARRARSPTSRVDLFAPQRRRRLRSDRACWCSRLRRRGPVAIHVRREGQLGAQRTAAFGQADQLHLGDLYHALRPADPLEELAELVIAAFGGNGDRNLEDVVFRLRLARLKQRHAEPGRLRGLIDGLVETGRLLLGRKLRPEEIQLDLELGHLFAEALQLGHLRARERELRRELLAPIGERRDLGLDWREQQEPAADHDHGDAEAAEDDFRHFRAVDEALDERRDRHRYASNRQVSSKVTMIGLLVRSWREMRMSTSLNFPDWRRLLMNSETARVEYAVPTIFSDAPLSSNDVIQRSLGTVSTKASSSTTGRPCPWTSSSITFTRLRTSASCALTLAP